MKSFYFTAFLMAMILILGCHKDEPAKISEFISGKEIPTQESWNSTIVFTDSGNTRAILQTAHLRMYSLSQTTLLDTSVKIDFYGRDSKKSSTLTSKRGKVDDKNRNLYAYENVVVKNDSGVVVETSELMWENTKQKIMTDKFVTITTPTEKIQGYGFESDQFIRNYIIRRITYVTNSTSFDK